MNRQRHNSDVSRHTFKPAVSPHPTPDFCTHRAFHHLSSNMIRTVADLLKALVDREREVLDAYELTHGPTIGAMYEGLTRSILDTSIPPTLGLQVVSGFACFGEQLSGELDCMVVRGTGEQIPYTEKYKWHISDVIAVFEVKKTLSAEELADSYDHLRAISTLYSKYVESDEATGVKVDLTLPRRVFSQMTGQMPPEHKKTESLPFDLEMIYHTLVTEFLGPVRVLVAHHGWKKEKTLRDHVSRLLAERLTNPRGMGAGSFPQLMIGGEYSLVKLNGLPYVGSLVDSMWPLIASTSHNPLRLLLELVFTKLDFLYSTNLALDDSNEQEALSLCLRARAVKSDDVQGWEYMYDDLSEKELRQRGTSYQWKPAEFTSGQFTIVNRLCMGHEIRTDSRDFVEFASKETGGLEAFIAALLASRLVATDGPRLRLTTVNCTTMITPDGKYVAGENNAGQMELWLEQRLGKPRSDWKALVVGVTGEDDAVSRRSDG